MSLRKKRTNQEQLRMARENKDAVASIVEAAIGKDWYDCGSLIEDRKLRQTMAFRTLPDEQRLALTWALSPSGCWEWLGSRKPNGYGQFRYRQRNWQAHRASYAIHVNVPPEDMHLDHLCLNKGCINPEHLEVVTPAENTRRYGQTITECPQGHPYSEENLLNKSRKGCRVCHNDRTRERNARKQVAMYRQGQVPKVRLSDTDIAEMKTFRADGRRVVDIAKLYGVSPKYTSAVIAGSRVRKARYTGPSKSTLLLLEQRSSGKCEFPDCAAPAVHTHHRRPRRAGGTRRPETNLPSNLLRLCMEHHEWIESNRTASLEMGMLLHASDNPATVPVRGVGGDALLDDLGGRTEVRHG